MTQAFPRLDGFTRWVMTGYRGPENVLMAFCQSESMAYSRAVKFINDESGTRFTVHTERYNGQTGMFEQIPHPPQEPPANPAGDPHA